MGRENVWAVLISILDNCCFAFSMGVRSFGHFQKNRRNHLGSCLVPVSLRACQGEVTAPPFGVAWLQTNGVNTDGVTAKVLFLYGFGKRAKNICLVHIKTANTEVHKLDGSTQKYLLSKSMEIAVTPLVLTPFVRC